MISYRINYISSKLTSSHFIQHYSFQPHRTLKERRSKKDNDNEAYRVIEGKVKHSKDYSNTIRFDEDPPVLWLVVKKGDEKTGRCVSSIGEWLLEEYNMDLAVIEKNPKDRVHDDDIVVFIDSKPSSSECSDIAEDIADVPEVNERRRGGMFDSGEQNLAYFDVSWCYCYMKHECIIVRTCALTTRTRCILQLSN